MGLEVCSDHSGRTPPGWRPVLRSSRRMLPWVLIPVAALLVSTAKGLALSETIPLPQRSRVPFENVEIEADRFHHEGTTTIYEGAVEVRGGTLRLLTDRLVYNEQTQEVEAIGHVVFEETGIYLTGDRALYNLKTRRGGMWNVRGHTDRSPDQTTLYFEAEQIILHSSDLYEVVRGRLTSCQGERPLWSLTTARMMLSVDRRVSLRWPAFRVKEIPVLVLPFVSVPLTPRVRSSGFLIPGISNSSTKGISLSIPYYQTLGRSADITPRLEIFTARGIGYGADLRARPGDRSTLTTGFFIVEDRLFGQRGPDQGGTAFYLRGVQLLPHGFIGTADVNVTSSLAFRQVFSDSFQQAISPEEKTEISLTNNFGTYSFNARVLARTFTLPGGTARLRTLPSLQLVGRPRSLGRFPAYVSVDIAADGISRKEPTFRTPSVVQRLDAEPRLSFPVIDVGGFTVTPEVALRATFYSDTADPGDRTRILGQSFTRRSLDVSLDIRPPALERTFHHRDGRRWFTHVIESSVIYRRTVGIGSNVARILRVDERDTLTDTNEIEVALINRLLTVRRTPEGQTTPHEILSVSIRQQYFFDPTFGGALVPGRRNQFLPLMRLSGLSFGGRARRWSPVNVTTRVEPLSSLFADVRFDYDVQENVLRNVSISAGLKRSLVSVFQTWFISRRIRLGAGGEEPGTFSGNLSQSSVTLGRQTQGFFVSADVLYDFTDRVIAAKVSSRRLVSSTVRAGYSFHCCSVMVQNTTFRIGVRRENRLAFALVLNGIGSFGAHTAAGRRVFDPYSPF